MSLDPIKLSRVRARAKQSESTCVERSALYIYSVWINFIFYSKIIVSFKIRLDIYIITLCGYCIKEIINMSTACLFLLLNPIFTNSVN